jgi:hypothetical protein
VDVFRFQAQQAVAAEKWAGRALGALELSALELLLPLGEPALVA